MSPKSSVRSASKRSLNFGLRESQGLSNKLKSMSMREKGRSLNRDYLNKTYALGDFYHENHEEDDVDR